MTEKKQEIKVSYAALRSQNFFLLEQLKECEKASTWIGYAISFVIGGASTLALPYLSKKAVNYFFKKPSAPSSTSTTEGGGDGPPSGGGDSNGPPSSMPSSTASPTTINDGSGSGGPSRVGLLDSYSSGVIPIPPSSSEVVEPHTSSSHESSLLEQPLNIFESSPVIPSAPAEGKNSDTSETNDDHQGNEDGNNKDNPPEGNGPGQGDASNNPLSGEIADPITSPEVDITS